MPNCREDKVASANVYGFLVEDDGSPRVVNEADDVGYFLVSVDGKCNDLRERSPIVRTQQFTLDGKNDVEVLFSFDFDTAP